MSAPFPDRFARPATRDETVRYMRGWCAVFALAVHEETGLPLVDAGSHVACATGDGRYVDIRGILGPEEFARGLRDGAEPGPATPGEIRSLLDAGLFKCGFPTKAEFARARRLARELIPRHGKPGKKDRS